MIVDSIRRQHLVEALATDEALDFDARERVYDALDHIPDGAVIPDDIEIPNGTDGETPEQVVALALDYYFG